MASGKEKVAAFAAAGIAAFGMYTAFEPPASPEEHQRNRQQQQVSDLSDSQDLSRENASRDGKTTLDAELKQRTIPGEHRPPVELPKIRIRLP